MLTRTKLNAAMVSGFGKYHTDNPEVWNHKDYTTIDMDGIRALVDKPQQVPKDSAQWVIPSTRLSRIAKVQETEGQYWAIWSDFDKDPQPLEKIHDVMVCNVVGVCDFELYNSRSATAEVPKARAIIPLDKPLCGWEWVLCQEVLNDLLEAAGLVPDRVTEQFNQVCYLPNRGEFYGSMTERGGDLFDPMTAWSEKIAAKRAAYAAAAAALEAERQAARERRATRQAARVASSNRPDLIAAFNGEYLVHDILLQAGYDQRGECFRHPGSASGSYSASVKDDRVHSLSSADPLYTDGGGVGAHDAFSAFTVLMHNRDSDAALRDAGDTWLKIGSESWNSVTQREYAKAEAQRQAEKAAAASWPDMADPFEQYVVPAFPVDALPEPFAVMCRELSAQSGFDVGGYAFAMLVATSSLIDHRKRMRAGPLSAQPFLWGGLVANSGGGKSPVISAATSGVRQINDVLVRESNQNLAQWVTACANTARNEPKPPKPVWRQFIASDTTTEGLGKLLQENESGILLIHDELTEFIGRMDAYSATGSGKDRGVYLRAYDGGSVTINRSNAHPMVINNFSVGILAGIQPEKLGELFRKSNGGADGLYQRFLMYVMQPAGAVDYSASLGMFTEVNATNLLNTLHAWTEVIGMSNVRLCEAGLPLMQAYHQEARTVSQRTPGRRLAEHLDKYPGFLARVTFALHCMECAATGELVDTVSVATLERAKRIMRCMYHHSIAVYGVIDSHTSDATKLTKSACEAILSKGWSTVQRGDLTRYATDWRDAEDRQAEGAIDCLIELGWIRDVTPAVERGKRGRRSSGVFLVNPAAHQRFKEHAQRISENRSARFKAIQELAATR